MVLYVFHKEISFASFDPVGATVIGLPTGLLDYLLLVSAGLSDSHSSTGGGHSLGDGYAGNASGDGLFTDESIHLGYGSWSWTGSYSGDNGIISLFPLQSALWPGHDPGSHRNVHRCGGH